MSSAPHQCHAEMPGKAELSQRMPAQRMGLRL